MNFLKWLFGKSSAGEPGLGDDAPLNRDQVAYATFLALGDPEPCQRAKDVDDHVFLLETPEYKELSNLIGNCPLKGKCGCLWSYTTISEEGSNEIPNFLAQNGGTASPVEIDSLEELRMEDLALQNQRKWAAEQVDSFLIEAEKLKTTKGKISRLKKNLTYIKEEYDHFITDSEVSRQVQRIETRINDLSKLP